MPDDREYMDGDNTPADFTRRRVAGILRRVRPRFEQGFNADAMMQKELLRMVSDTQRTRWGLIQLGQTRIVTYNLFPNFDTFDVFWPSKHPIPYCMKKRANNNFQSRFIKHPAFLKPPAPD